MKFQNPSLNFFSIGRSHTETDGQNQYAPHFFKVGGITKQNSNLNIKKQSNHA